MPDLDDPSMVAITPRRPKVAAWALSPSNSLFQNRQPLSASARKALQGVEGWAPIASMAGTRQGAPFASTVAGLGQAPPEERGQRFRAHPRARR